MNQKSGQFQVRSNITPICYPKYPVVFPENIALPSVFNHLISNLIEPMQVRPESERDENVLKIGRTNVPTSRQKTR